VFEIDPSHWPSRPARVYHPASRCTIPGSQTCEWRDRKSRYTASSHEPTGHNICEVVRECRKFRGGQQRAASVAPTETITVVFFSSAE